MVSHDSHIEELLGAYALNAVDDDERVVVEEHLRECPKCSHEVAEHREIAAILSSESEAAPENLWTAIEDSISPPDNVIPLRRKAPRPANNWILSVAAAAALVLVGAVFLQSTRIDRLAEEVAAERAQVNSLTDLLTDQPLSAAVDAALADPLSQVITIEATDAAGAGAVTVVLTAEGTGFVIDDTLPSLPDGQTYQLWAVADGEVVSAGLFGTDVANTSFRIDPGTVSALAITPEVAGGVVVSNNDAVAAVALDS